MNKKITLSNIQQYLEGNSQMILDRMGLQPDWYREQIAYRMLQCKDDCIPAGKCKYCGCSVPGKLYVTQSCNYGSRFPDLMNEENWNKYKEEHQIK